MSERDRADGAATTGVSCRLRLAPTPSGPLHAGGARVAWLNHELARVVGGVLRFRIEDTDHHPELATQVERLVSDLRLLGVGWSGKTWHQSERFAVYQNVGLHLLEQGAAYWCRCPRREAPGRGPSCDCSGQQLAQARDTCLRLRPGQRVYDYDDLILGPVRADLRRDPVLIRSDGRALYHFATVVDDFEMEITHVIRGEDHRVGTAAQLAIYEALGVPAPRFGHLPLLLAEDGDKLSKRTGARGIAGYFRDGFSVEVLRAALEAFGRPGAWRRLRRAGNVAAAESALRAFGTPPPRWSVRHLLNAHRQSHRSNSVEAFRRSAWSEARELGFDREAIRRLLDDDRRVEALRRRSATPTRRRSLLAGALLPDLLADGVRFAEREREVLDAWAASGTPSLDALRACAERHGLAESDALRCARRALFGFDSGPPLVAMLGALDARAWSARIAGALAPDGAQRVERAATRLREGRVSGVVASLYDVDVHGVCTHLSENNHVWQLEVAGGAPVFVKQARTDATEPLVHEALAYRALSGRARIPTRVLLDVSGRFFHAATLSYQGVPGDSITAERFGERFDDAVAQLAKVHAVDDPPRGLPYHPIGWMEAVGRLMSRYQEYLRLRLLRGAPDSPLTEGMTSLVLTLRDHALGWDETQPQPIEPVLCHGDPRFHNLIEHEGELSWIDFEVAHVGSVLRDLALLITFNDVPARRIVDVAGTYSAATGRDAQQLTEWIDAATRVQALTWAIELLARAEEALTSHRSFAQPAHLLWREGLQRLATAVRRVPGAPEVLRGLDADALDALDGREPGSTWRELVDGVITIDGPAASLKSPVAASLANLLGVAHIPAGALFRLATWIALREGIALDAGHAIADALAPGTVVIESITVDPWFRIGWRGMWLSNELYALAVEDAVARVADLEPVKEAVRRWARSQGPNLVVEGRHTGRELFPDARHKFFFVASARARTDRKWVQLSALGERGDISQIEQSVTDRDARDFAPARIVLDDVDARTHVIDTTRLTVDEVLARIRRHLGE